MDSDTNAHHTGWGSSNMIPIGQLLAEFLVASDLYWSNIGIFPPFRVTNRSEVIDITLADSITLYRVTNWQVSGNPSLSDHVFITFNLCLNIAGGRWVRTNKADWNLYS